MPLPGGVGVVAVAATGCAASRRVPGTVFGVTVAADPRTSPAPAAAEATPVGAVPAPQRVDVSAVVIPDPRPLGELWVVGDPSVLDLPAVAVVGSRTSSPFTSRIAEVAVEAACATVNTDGCAFAAPLPAVALWVRLSPAGAERVVVAAAAAAGVPVVAWCASGPDLPPLKIVAEVIASGGVLCSAAAPGEESSEFSVAVRDRAVARACAAVVAVDGTVEQSPDTLAVLADAVLSGVPLVVARPRKGHRRGADAHLSQVLSGAKRLSRLGWPAAAVSALSRFEQPAHSVCESPEEVVTALGFWWRWGSTPDLSTVLEDAPVGEAPVAVDQPAELPPLRLSV